MGQFGEGAPHPAFCRSDRRPHKSTALMPCPVMRSPLFDRAKHGAAGEAGRGQPVVDGGFGPG